MSQLLVAQRALTVPGWAKDALWRRAQAIPSLDLRFAENKSLVDATTGAQLVTFTRASSGTFVGSDGLIKSAVTNLVLRSEDFSATWSLNNLLAFGSGSTVDAAVAPNGAITADLIVENTSNTTHSISQTFSIVSGNAYTGSVYLKTASRTWAYLQFDGNLWAESGSRPRVWVNLSTGQLGSSDRNSGVSIANVGNGWYRITLTATANTSATSSFSIALTTADANFSSYTGDGTSGIYLWGAQLEQSSTVGEYIPTTSAINSAPRFDHNPTTGESLGLLVEEARTNIAISSQVFNGAPYAVTNATVADNQVTAPNGTSTAASVLETATTGGHNLARDVTSKITVTASTVYTFSVFLKPNGRDFIQISSNTGDVTGNPRANYDIANGTLGTVDSGVTATISRFPNGWVRISYTVTSASTGINFIIITITTSTAARFESFAGDITKGFYVWGYSLEAGAFPTSYIPTTTATVTRSADVASDTTRGGNIRSLFTQFRSPASGTRPVVSLDDNTANERIEILTSGTDPKLLVTDGGSAVADLNGGTVTANVAARIAARFNTDDYAISINGGTSQLDAAGTLPTATRIRIGSNQAGGYLNGTIARITGWDSPLNLVEQLSQ